jgi:hypothetical protein
MQAMRLGSISSIQTGYSFRNGLTASHEGVLVVQLKDVRASGIIDADALSRADCEDYSEQHRLNLGDLVFRSRGQSFSMGLTSFVGELIIVAAPLFKVTVDRSMALPEYVSWYANGPAGQAYFESVAEGSSIKMISKASLAELPIPLPPLSVQESIAQLTSLGKQEKMLSEQLLRKRELLINTRIQRYLQES